MHDEPTLERTLIIAPHPDDDAIAAAGLIQRAIDSGASVRVVFVTDGENNPWPQRWTHRKWFINDADRAAWGAMRRREALDALHRLGVGDECATFLAFPDQHIATMARRGDTHLLDALRAIIDNFHPTLIVSPSTHDLHADHRAIAYFAHVAAGDTTAITTYIIHGDAPDPRLVVRVDLTEREVRRKRASIECHQSQLLLSRERFLSYARPFELFYAAEHDVVAVESRLAEVLSTLRHALRVCFGIYRDPRSGVQPAADVQNGAGDVAGLL